MKDFEGGFFKAPNDIFEIGLDPYQIAVYLYLTRCGNNADAAYPAKGTIAEKCGMSVRKVDSVVNELESMGLVRVQRKNGVANIYIITDPNILAPSNQTSARHAGVGGHIMRGTSAQHAPNKELSYKEPDYKEKRYIDLPIDDEYLKIYNLYFQRKFNKPHMRVTEEQLQWIYEQLEEVREGYDLKAAEFKEIVERHFRNLPDGNNGNIIAFFYAFQRYFYDE